MTSTFQELGLRATLLKALSNAGYTTPTPIQARAIPPLLEGRDLLGIAQTGTGKTAAFALPILERLAAHPKPAPRKGARVLVLTPTRELATQIGESFRTYGRHMGVKTAIVFGGMPHGRQVQAMAGGVDILVATPGRLLDHVQQRTITLEATDVFVLDEVDQMLDLGFIVPIRRLVRALPAKRQNLFFSATMPVEIAALAAELLRNPVEVRVAPSATPVELIDQKVILVEAANKRGLLIELLANPELARVLVFTRTKHGADKVAHGLTAAGISAIAMHGNKSQGQRRRALDEFQSGHTRVLVATDIAARGLDIDDVSHVVNFDLPHVPESYVHRIGRTGRAGAAGFAIAFCDNEERGLLRDIERVTRQSLPLLDRRRGPAPHAVQERPARPSGDHRRPHRDNSRPGAPGRNKRKKNRNPQKAQGHRPARGN